MKTTVKTDSDKIKAIVGMIRYLRLDYESYYHLDKGYDNKLLPIFSDGSNMGMLRVNMVAFINQNIDVFSFYGITTNNRSTINYSGKPVYW